MLAAPFRDRHLRSRVEATRSATPPGTGRSRPLLTFLGGLLAFGAVASGIACITLAFPGTFLDMVWRINPRGHAGLMSLGTWAVILMAAVCGACVLASRGIWTRAAWGHRLAVGLLALNAAADTVNAFVLGDRRTLVGLPVAAALIAYLLSPDVRGEFHDREKTHAG